MHKDAPKMIANVVINNRHVSFLNQLLANIWVFISLNVSNPSPLVTMLPCMIDTHTCQQKAPQLVTMLPYLIDSHRYGSPWRGNILMTKSKFGQALQVTL